MPVNTTITKDRLVAIVTLTKPRRNENPLSADEVFGQLETFKFSCKLSTDEINNMLVDFMKSDAEEANFRIFSDIYVRTEHCFSVRVDPREMSAFVDVDVSLADSKYVSYDVIHRKMKQAKVVTGALATNISKLVSRCRKGAFSIKDFQVAAGTDEITGKDGYVAVNQVFKKNVTLKRTVRREGGNKALDLPALVSEKEVTRDMVLLTRYLPEPGVEGMTVTGKKIWSEGNTKSVKSHNVTASKNVATRNFPDRVEYLSTVRGVGYYINEQIVEVEEVFDGEFNIRADKDGMRAFLSLRAPRGGKKIDLADIAREIETMGIKTAIDKVKIREAMDKVNSLEDEKADDILITEGEEPSHGLDGQIKWNILLEMFYKPVILDDGSTDYRGGHRYPFVRTGDTAGIWFLETKGEKPGHDIFGNPIEPRDGEPETLSLNELFEFVPTIYEGRKARFLKAKVSGLLFIKKDVVYIEPTFETEVIDHRTGNIDFDGNVIVKKEIAAGFTVKCTKDIHITGNIGACIIECGGDAFIKGGMNGNGKGIIRSGGNTFLKYCENGSVYANKGIYLISHSLISVLVAKSEVRIGIDRVKGRIIGSSVYAWSLIRTAFVGTERSTARSLLHAGIDKEVSDAFDAINSKIYLCKLDITAIQKRHAELNESNSDPELIRSAELELGTKLAELNEMNTKAIGLKQSIYNAETPSIEISDMVFEDTKVIIADKDLRLSQSTPGARYTLGDGIVVSERTGKTRNGTGARSGKKE